jgi:hypothetical protein
VLTPRTYTINKYLSDEAVFYFEPGSDASLADRLRFMWHNPGEVLKRLTQAREVLPALSWQAEKSKFLSFYAEITGKAKAARG